MEFRVIRDNVRRRRMELLLCVKYLWRKTFCDTSVTGHGEVREGRKMVMSHVTQFMNEPLYARITQCIWPKYSLGRGRDHVARNFPTFFSYL